MNAILTVGLGFGDEGKGKTVSALVQRTNAEVVVRYNGGAQAAHNVVVDGVHHTFSQFGSGTFNKGTKTFLGSQVLVNPLAMEREAEVLEGKGVENPLSLMYVDMRCRVTTPYHVAVNRLRELSRGESKHGSCGMGIGECMEESLKAPANTLLVMGTENLDVIMGQLKSQRNRAIELISEFKLNKESEAVQQELRVLECDTVLVQVAVAFMNWAQKINIVRDGGKELLNTGNIVFEGAQGALLHEDLGFPPYNTWSDTSLTNAEAILKEIGYEGKVTRLGILRTYSTRHGAGPFVSENEVISGLLKDEHNPENPWQDAMRFGLLDICALKYGLHIAGNIDYLVLTHVDALKIWEQWPLVTAYFEAMQWDLMESAELWGNDLVTVIAMNSDPVIRYVPSTEVINLIEITLGKRIAILSSGADVKDTTFEQFFLNEIEKSQ